MQTSNSPHLKHCDLTPVFPDSQGSSISEENEQSKIESINSSNSSSFIHPNIILVKELFDHQNLPIPGPIHLNALIQDPIKLATLLSEIPYCLHRTYEVLRSLIGTSLRDAKLSKSLYETCRSFSFS